MIADVLSGARPWHVACADAFDFAAGLPDGCASLVWLDPPYNLGKAEWDTFPDRPAFLAFIGRVLDVCKRVMAPNGSLYLCTATEVSDLVSVEVRGRFELLNSVHWKKGDENGNGQHSKAEKEALRSYFPASERILFAEHYGADGVAIGASGYTGACDELRGFVFEPLRAYLDGERRRAGVGKAECNAACGFSPSAGGMASRHYFSASQWCLPTRAHYEALQRLFNSRPPADYLRREYDDLRQQYESLRRPFAVSSSVPYTDCWTYPTVQSSDGKHLCEKPPAMLRDVIAASSRTGDIVLDLFAGSCVAGEQALLQGRRYLGCDADPEWGERRGPARLRRAEVAPHDAGRPIRAAAVDGRQGRLL